MFKFIIIILSFKQIILYRLKKFTNKLKPVVKKKEELFHFLNLQITNTFPIELH